MSRPLFHPRRAALALVTAGSLLLAPLALSHLDDKEVLQSYRQSWFAMLGVNFGAMASMVKGETPWDAARMAVYAEQVDLLAKMDIGRAFADGSDKGTTRAKPEIWQDKADFDAKLQDFKQAAAELRIAADSGDRAAIGAQVAATGEACKACHDEYKSKDYLY